MKREKLESKDGITGAEKSVILLRSSAFSARHSDKWEDIVVLNTGLRQGSRYFYFNPYPTAFPYGNGMVLHFYQQQESSTTKTVHKVINKRLKTYV